MSGICRTGPAGAEVAAVSPRKRAFAASGPPKTDRCSREGQIPQQTPKQTLQIRGSLAKPTPRSEGTATQLFWGWAIDILCCFLMASNPLPSGGLEARIALVCPKGGGKGRQPHPLPAMLRVHCVQPFCNMSDPAMKDLHGEEEQVRADARGRGTGKLAHREVSRRIRFRIGVPFAVS